RGRRTAASRRSPSSGSRSRPTRLDLRTRTSGRADRARVVAEEGAGRRALVDGRRGGAGARRVVRAGVRDAGRRGEGAGGPGGGAADRVARVTEVPAGDFDPRHAPTLAAGPEKPLRGLLRFGEGQTRARPGSDPGGRAREPRLQAEDRLRMQLRYA